MAIRSPPRNETTSRVVTTRLASSNHTAKCQIAASNALTSVGVRVSPTYMAAVSILRATLSIPTAPFHEHGVAAQVRAFARERGLPVRADRFGNLIVRLRRGRSQPIAFAAHMDHPGFEVVGVNGRTATLQSYGDTRGKNAVGAKIRAQTVTGEVTGVATILTMVQKKAQ